MEGYYVRANGRSSGRVTTEEETVSRMTVQDSYCLHALVLSNAVALPTIPLRPKRASLPVRQPAFEQCNRSKCLKHSVGLARAIDLGDVQSTQESQTVVAVRSLPAWRLGNRVAFRGVPCRSGSCQLSTLCYSNGRRRRRHATFTTRDESRRTA